MRVDKGYTTPATDEKAIDLKNKIVMPGLTDLHVENKTSKDQYLKRMSYSPADIAFEAQKHALTTLMAGFPRFAKHQNTAKNAVCDERRHGLQKRMSHAAKQPASAPLAWRGGQVERRQAVLRGFSTHLF